MNINLTLVGETIMFAMFVWFCMKFIWPPLVDAMAARKKSIEDGLQAAERGKEEHAQAKQNAEELCARELDVREHSMRARTRCARALDVRAHSMCART